MFENLLTKLSTEEKDSSHAIIRENQYLRDHRLLTESKVQIEFCSYIADSMTKPLNEKKAKSSIASND